MIRINIIINKNVIPIAFNSLPLISSLLQLLSAALSFYERLAFYLLPAWNAVRKTHLL